MLPRDLGSHFRHQHHHHDITHNASSTIHDGESYTSWNVSPIPIAWSVSTPINEAESTTTEFWQGNFTTAGPNSTFEYPCFNRPYHRAVYPIALPILIFFCTLAIFINAIIVISARWCRRPMSPTMYFSISLAVADTFSSIHLMVGLVVNSLLPCVYGFLDIVVRTQCFQLTLEAFRLGTILVSVTHLFTLAINHWIGIVRPLHYAATMTRRTAWILIGICWSCPTLLVFLYFSSHPGEGFLTSRCRPVHFLSYRTFRLMFASCFFAPLLIMCVIYVHIFFIVKSHHQHRLRYQSCQQLRRNIKAVSTTVFILGTYILGWGPGILWFIIVCKNCFILLETIPEDVSVPINIVIQTLIILKALVNPIIYAARMSDIQLALKKMQYEIFRRCCGNCLGLQPPVDPMERGYSTSHRSIHESRSLRASRRESSRRSGLRTSIGQNQPVEIATPDGSHCASNTGANGNGPTNRTTFELGT